jgi:NPCBM-associated, NEW3 domain of alpha-galactosidase
MNMCSMTKWLRLPTQGRATIGALIFWVFSTASQVSAQGGADEQTRWLEVRRRQVELAAVRAQFQQTDDLFSQGLASKRELDTARTAVQLAQLNYQTAVLTLLNAQPRVTVKEAVKYEGSDGRRFIRVRLSNETPAIDDSQFELLSNFDGAEALPESLKNRTLRDVLISLKDTGERTIVEGFTPRQGTTIAIPYEERVAELAFGASRTLTFQLLRDVDSIQLAIQHRGGRQDIDVELQQEATERPVAISALQFSQEADLGAQATYELRLQRPTVDSRSFKLAVFNLPREITSTFLDPRTGARISELSFPPGVTQQLLELRLFLPEQTSSAVAIDQALQFFTVARIGDEALDLESQTDLATLKNARVGYAELAIIPRGVGKIEVSAPTLFSELTAGETLRADLSLRNTGTRRLDTVRFILEAPPGWRVEMTPATLAGVELGETKMLKLLATPPDSVPAGDYEVRIRTESFAFNRPVPSEDKVYRITVKSRVHLVGIVLIVSILIAAIVGIVVAGVRLARR